MPRCAWTASCRSGPCASSAIPATAARSTSTSRWSTGACASAACGCPCACASTCSASTATPRSRWRARARARRASSRASSAMRATRSRPTCGSSSRSCSAARWASGCSWRWPCAARACRCCAGAIAAGATRAGAGRRDHRAAAAARRPRDARVLRPRPGHPARAARGRVGRGERQRARPRSSTASSSASRGWSTAPAERATLGGRPQITVASDLHNNLLAVPALQRVARGTPLFFVGDLTDRGTPLEAQLTSGILHAGTRFVFVTGNHDSDSEAQELADDGAIVLTEHGRLLRGGRYGPMVVRVAGLRVAGYGDPFRRRRARGYVQQGTLPDALGRPSRTCSPSGWPAWRTRSTSSWSTSPRWPRRRSTRCAATRRRTRSCCSSATRTTRTSSIDRDFTRAQRRDGRRRRDGQPQRGGEDRRGADDLLDGRRRSRRWRPTSWRSTPATDRPRRSASGSTNRPRSKVANSVDRPSRRRASSLVKML